MLLALTRTLLLLAALFVPGGLFFMGLAAVWRRYRKTPTLDFDGSRRRVPDTRRGRHARILVSGT